MFCAYVTPDILRRYLWLISGIATWCRPQKGRGCTTVVPDSRQNLSNLAVSYQWWLWEWSAGEKSLGRMTTKVWNETGTGVKWKRDRHLRKQTNQRKNESQGEGGNKVKAGGESECLKPLRALWCLECWPHILHSVFWHGCHCLHRWQILTCCTVDKWRGGGGGRGGRVCGT